MALFVRYSSAAVLLLQVAKSQDVGLSICAGEELRQASAGCTSASACAAAAEQMGLTIGSPTFGFSGDWDPRGCYYYPSEDPNYPNTAFYGTPGTCEDLSAATNDGSIRITCEGTNAEDFDVQGPSDPTGIDVQGPSDSTVTPTTEATTTPETTTTATETTFGTTECDDSSICVSEDDCKNEALAMGLELGGAYVFAGPWDIKGCHYYPQGHPAYGGQAYFGTGSSSCAALSETPWDGSSRMACGSGAQVAEDIPTDLPEEPAPPAAAPTNDVVSTVAPTGTSSVVSSLPVEDVVNPTEASNLTSTPADLPVISTTNPTETPKQPTAAPSATQTAAPSATQTAAPSAARTAAPSPTQTPTAVPTNATTSPTTPINIPETQMVTDVPQTPMANATTLATVVPTVAATDATNPPSSVLNAPTVPPTITPTTTATNFTAFTDAPLAVDTSTGTNEQSTPQKDQLQEQAPPQAAEEVVDATELPSQAPGTQEDGIADDNQVGGKDDKQQDDKGNDQQKDDKDADDAEGDVAAGPGGAGAGGAPGFANNNGTEPFFAEGPGAESNGVVDAFGDGGIAAIKSSATMVLASRHLVACALATVMAMCCFM